MSPEVEAATIAGCFGVLTLIGTVIAQIIGFRSTRANTEQQINATHNDTAATLKAQGDQLKQTLAEQRTRTLNERFATAADKLGSDKPAIRLAGVHAMAGLADDWGENRQTCVDVLCAYLRLPYEPDPGDGAAAEKRLAFRADREVRHTVIRIIGDHLRPGDAVSWQNLDLNFTGVAFDGGDFSSAVFSGGEVSFQGAVFSGGEVSFRDAVFSADVSFVGAEFAGEKAAVKNNVFDFSGAKFVGGKIAFREARFSGGTVWFGKSDGAVFSGGEVSFEGGVFSGSDVTFYEAEFTGSDVSFERAKFSGGRILFGRKGVAGAMFSDGKISFLGATFSGTTEVSFDHSKFSGTEVSFLLATFSGGQVSFYDVEFTGSDVGFYSTTFSGSDVSFEKAKFSGGEVDFTGAVEWSHPPRFDWDGPAPAGVKLPAAAGGQSQ